MKSRAALLVLLGVGVLFANVRETTRYFTCPVSQLEITEGQLLPPRYGNKPVGGEVIDLFNDWNRDSGPLTVEVDGGGSAEFVIQYRSGAVRWDDVYLAIKTDQPGPVTGNFKYPKDKQMQLVRWRFPANANTERARQWFQYGVAARLDRTYRPLLQNPDTPGQAWFRHRLTEIHSLKSSDLAGLWRNTGDTNFPASSRKKEPLEPDFSLVLPITVNDWGTAPRWDNRGEFSELFSGGRAISENLQLHREINVRNDDRQATVKITDVNGIDVKEYDWGPHVRGLRPSLDPLAKWIPADQHAVFFPNVASAMALLEEIDRTGLAVWNLTSIRGVDDRITDRYMKQLALPTTQLAKLMPATLVDNVAVTGSDVYYDTGTDVAVLLSTTKPGLVRQLLLANWAGIKAERPDAVEKEETIDGSVCKTLITPDRRICSYIVENKDVLLITNSPVQVRRLFGPRNGPETTLDQSSEYIYFRDRYRRGDADETAFVMLTDAAIRRWCGPAWRIGHQRRIQTGSSLADAQAAQLKSMIEAKSVRTVADARLGPIDVSPFGISSKVYGSRLFQTPIAEAAIETVTKAEADGYNRWRDTYQQNWSQFFDPIAAKVSIKPERLGFDITVMPLIAQSQYREMVALSTGATLTPQAGDPHPEAIAHFVMGLNRKNNGFKKQMQQWSLGFGEEAPIDTWIGDWVALYFDQDPILEEFVKFEGREWDFWQQHQYQFPLGLAIAINDPKQHAKFVEAVTPKITGVGNPTRPGKHKDVNYRIIHIGGLNIYSLILPEQWVIAPNERVIHRAIDRYVARKDGKAPASPGWLGDSVGFTAKPQAVQVFSEWWSRSALSTLQQSAWANLPILNEWHALNANIDPVSFHEKWWGERLIEPAGGQYVWNATDQTMESTTLGHPGRPKGTRATLPASLSILRGANFGITFEKEGLRARGEIARQK